MTDPSGAPAGLAALEHTLRRDLDLVDYPRRPWLAARTSADDHDVLDVIIVGAG